MAVPLYPWAQFPQQHTQLTKANGAASQPFWYFMQALFKRTGGASGNPNTVGANLAATGNSQETALVLSDDYNQVTDGSGGGVQLAALQPAQNHTIENASGGDIKIYPPPGGQIDALGVNQPYTLANGKSQVMTCTQLSGDARQFSSTQLG